jgi:hypothetical protein
MSGGRQKELSPPPRQGIPPRPGSIPEESAGSIAGGLGGLLKKFQDAGLGEVIDSWISTGPDKTVASGQIAMHLGPMRSMPWPSAPNCLEIKSRQFCPNGFPEQSTSSPLKGGCRHIRRLLG